MTWEYLHLITHSFPIVLTLTGSVIGFTGWITNREELERWGIIALLIGGIFVIPAYVTGLAAADVLAERTFVQPSAVQSHRIGATWSMVPVLLAGALAGFSLYERDDRRLRRFVLIVGAAAALVTGYAAFLGARIDHRPPAPEVTLALCLLVLLAVPGAVGAQGSRLEERARRLHEDALVVDGHNDLPWRLRGIWGLDLSGVELDRRRDDGHTDLVRLREGGVDLQFWAAYVPPRFTGQEAPRVAFEQIDLIERLAARYPDYLEMAHTSADVERIVESGRTASMIGVEGGHAIDNSLETLRALYEAGARYLTLTHSATLDWVDAAGDEPRHGGLTEFGRDVIREMNRLGMLVDISHVTDEAMRDVLEVTRAPVIFSHSSARALADHSRNVPDDVLAATARNGGIVMVNFFSGFLTDEGARSVANIFREEDRLRRENPEPDDFREALDGWYRENAPPRGDVGTIVDHIDHIVQVAGVDHVGLGSDFDGIPMVPEGMGDVSRFPAITEEMLRRGYSDEEVRKVLGENFMRVLRRVEEIAGKGR